MTRPLPDWMTNPSPFPDHYPTASSDLQLQTAQECLPFLIGQDEDESRGEAILLRSHHIAFLQDFLGDLPAGFKSLDASRPWQLYWCLNGLALLGHNVSQYRQSLVDTLKPIQNPSGGFGGGQGQCSHLATTYASTLSLVLVGGEDALGLVDRRAMWEWLGRLKQSHGGFQMAVGGEVDVRGAYCALTILSLLQLPMELPSSSPARSQGLKTFLDGLPEWVGRCQTYEGGIGSAPDYEAHGAYTFCALACLCIIGSPETIINKYLDVDSLIAWLAQRQHVPEGGLAGRSNKLVDGCYSHWLGGCWSLVEAAVFPSNPTEPNTLAPPPALWDREALSRYILCCCQEDSGGLRDKPSKPPDPYHSNYNIAGLGSTQHHYIYQTPQNSTLDPQIGAWFNWACLRGSVDGDQRVEPMHPVYVIPWGAAERAKAFFGMKELTQPLRP